MSWEPAATLEYQKNLSLECWEDSKERVTERGIRERTRRIGFVTPTSICLKLLGIFCVAQQFTVAAAEGICHAADKVKEQFDLLGLISAFGTVAATKSLSYSALNDGSFYLTGHIAPGSLKVAASLFEASESRLARLLAFGGGGNACDLVQLDCPKRVHYFGLKSSTECAVGNAVGVSIVSEYQSLWEENQREEQWAWTERESLGRRVGRDARRDVKVIVLKVGITDVEEYSRTNGLPVTMKGSKGSTLLLGWLPFFLTFGVTVSCINCNQWFVALLIFTGTLGMMLAVWGLRLCRFRYSKPQVATGAPPGDCLIVDETDANTLHVVLAEEEIIQALFQRKIEFQVSLGKPVLILAGFILYAYVITSVLYMPKIAWSGQIHFAIANLIGFSTDLLKASHDGKLGLAKAACEQFDIVVRDMVVFGNRTAAVAYVAKHAKDRSMLKSKKLLPCDGYVWQVWWETLVNCGNGSENIRRRISRVLARAEREDQALQRGLGREDHELLRVLLNDMADGLEA